MEDVHLYVQAEQVPYDHGQVWIADGSAQAKLYYEINRNSMVNSGNRTP